MNEEINPEPRKTQDSEDLLRESLKKINGSEISQRVADLCNCSRLQSHRGLQLTIDSIIDLTLASQNLNLTGIGTLAISQKNYSATPCQNNSLPENRVMKSTLSFYASRVLKSIINEPLGKHSLGLASFDPTDSINTFRRVSSITQSELPVIEKVVTNNKANTEDLYNLMRCRGMPSKQIAHNFFHALRSVIRDALVKNESISISGFGKFSVKDFPPRQSIHPRTLEQVTFPAHRRVSFRPSGEFKERLVKFNQTPS